MTDSFARDIREWRTEQSDAIKPEAMGVRALWRVLKIPAIRYLWKLGQE
jgi:hypothetical protein